jgi:hypothetical protein
MDEKQIVACAITITTFMGKTSEHTFGNKKPPAMPESEWATKSLLSKERYIEAFIEEYLDNIKILTDKKFF